MNHVCPYCGECFEEPLMLFTEKVDSWIEKLSDFWIERADDVKVWRERRAIKIAAQVSPNVRAAVERQL